MPKALINGINVHYQQTGRGPDLVLIHGFGSNLALWQLGILPGLVQDLRITTYDLRGHGYTDMPPRGYNLEYMASDLNGLLAHLGIAQASFLGHSYGGVVALHYAQLHPQRVVKLVIADTGVPSLEPDRRQEFFWQPWRDGLRRAGVDVPDKWGDDVGYLLEQTLRQRERFRAGRGARRNFQRLLGLIETTSFVEDYRELPGLTLEMIRQIQAPVLLSYGENSPMRASFRCLQENLPDCRSVITPKGGHFHLLEQPESFVKNLQDFLKERGGEPGRFSGE